MNQKISIVIPCFNEEKTIENTLRALSNQTFGDFEVIFVDGCSNDKTAEIVERWKEKFKSLQFTVEKRKGIGVARNTGSKAAKGEILVGTDADVVPEPEWLAKIAAEFEKGADALVGTYRFHDKSKIFNLFFRFFMITSDYFNRLFLGTFTFRGLNHAVKKSVYEKAGGFNTQISALEDLELSLRVKKLANIKYRPRIVILTSYRRFEGRFFKQLIKRLKAYWNRAILRNNKEADWEVVR